MRTKTNRAGFTIIEVLIVLAIAALILLIVFLSVSSLQRNARNTGRKHDAGFVAAQRQFYDEDNGTRIPPPGTDVSGNCSPPYGNPGVQTFCGYVTSGLVYYDPANITFISDGDQPATVPTETDPDKLISANYLVCNNSLTGATTVGADRFDMVMLYAVENGSSSEAQCLQTSLFQG